MISKKNKKKFFIFSILCFLIFIFFWLNINSIFSSNTKDFISSFYNYHFSYKLDQEDDNEKYNALQIENTKSRNLLDIKNNNQELNIIFSKVIFKYPSVLKLKFKSRCIPIFPPAPDLNAFICLIKLSIM